MCRVKGGRVHGHNKARVIFSWRVLIMRGKNVWTWHLPDLKFVVLKRLISEFEWFKYNHISSPVQCFICSSLRVNLLYGALSVSTGALVKISCSAAPAWRTHISDIFWSRHRPLAATSQYFADCWRYDWRTAHLHVSLEAQKTLTAGQVQDLMVFCRADDGGSLGGREAPADAEPAAASGAQQSLSFTLVFHLHFISCWLLCGRPTAGKELGINRFYCSVSSLSDITSETGATHKVRGPLQSGFFFLLFNSFLYIFDQHYIYFIILDLIIL